MANSMARSSTSYRSKWNSGPTTVIRVPSRLTDEVLRYAHEIDAQEPVGRLREPEIPYRTAQDVSPTEPVNVASVPQRSPFRYPGGKTWLVPYVRSWLRYRKSPPSLLVEPFAGGAIVGLTAGFEELARHVVLVESDPNVAAVWKTLLRGRAEWLASDIE